MKYYSAIKYRLLLSFLLFAICGCKCSAQEINTDTTSISLDSVKVFTYNLKGQTASGLWTHKINEPFVAISRDILHKFPMTSYIELSDCPWAGKFKILDIMGKLNVNSIDIYYAGKRRNVCFCKIQLVE